MLFCHVQKRLNRGYGKVGLAALGGGENNVLFIFSETRMGIQMIRKRITRMTICRHTGNDLNLAVGGAIPKMNRCRASPIPLRILISDHSIKDIHRLITR